MGVARHRSFPGGIDFFCHLFSPAPFQRIFRSHVLTSRGCRASGIFQRATCRRTFWRQLGSVEHILKGKTKNYHPGNLHIPYHGTFEDYFPFLMVRYVCLWSCDGTLEKKRHVFVGGLLPTPSNRWNLACNARFVGHALEAKKLRRGLCSATCHGNSWFHV